MARVNDLSDAYMAAMRRAQAQENAVKALRRKLRTAEKRWHEREKEESDAKWALLRAMKEAAGRKE